MQWTDKSSPSSTPGPSDGWPAGAIGRITDKAQGAPCPKSYPSYRPWTYEPRNVYQTTVDCEWVQFRSLTVGLLGTGVADSLPSAAFQSRDESRLAEAKAN